MIDLHMHTKHSDGTDSCIELLESAQKKGLNVISVTDHNTVGAYDELARIKIEDFFKGRIIPGIELNTKVLNVPIEILGYGINTTEIKQLLKSVYLPAEERNKIEAKRLYNKCIALGLHLDEDCLERYEPNGFASKFIQSEIKKYEENKVLIEQDVWNDSKLFYRKYMSNPEGPLYVEMDDLVPDFSTAASLIRKCGGLVFIPHIFEYRQNAGKILNFILKNYDIDGIECYYTTFSDEQTRKVLEVCKERNLYVSGGSDYHGKAKPNVQMGIGFGNLNIDNSVIDNWKDKVKSFKNTEIEYESR